MTDKTATPPTLEDRPVPDFDQPLYSLLDTAADTHPDRLAIVFQNTRISYARLQTLAEVFAAALRRMGVKPGDRVAIMLPNLPQTIIAFWGVMKAGGVAVMTNPLYMESEIVHHMRDSGATHLILLDMLWAKIAPLREKLPIRKYIVTGVADALSFPLNWLYRLKCLKSKNRPHIQWDTGVIPWKRLFQSQEQFCLNTPVNPDTVALLQYTGGTTGVPKGVMLTHRNLGSNCNQVIVAVDEIARRQHRFIALLPFFHVYGLTVGLIIPAALTATVLPVPMYAPQDLLKLIDKHKPSIFPGAPAVYVSLMQQKNIAQFNLKSIELCISGSAPLSAEQSRRFHALTGARLIEGYGLTEASPITHLNPVDVDGPRSGYIGKPLPATMARVVDMESGSLTLPPNKLGELVVKGPQVMLGYWNHPDETACALRNGWLYTGDLAMVDEEGYYRIVDRKKDMVIVAGYNVYPREVDEVLLEHPDIAEAVAVGVQDPTRGDILKAFVVLRPGARLGRAEVIAWCRGKLASYKVPRQVEFRESLPKTIVGKVLRRALREEEEQKAATRRAANKGNADGGGAA